MKLILTFFFIFVICYIVNIIFVNYQIKTSQIINNAYSKERVEKFKENKMENPDVIFLGNSIFEQYDIVKYFNAEYLNRGISGNTSSTVLSRLDEIIERNPKKIVLLIGINDISKGITKDTFLFVYNKILTSIKSKCPITNVYTISILPVNNKYNLKSFIINVKFWITFNKPIDMNNTICKINNEIERITQINGFRYLNLNPYFVDSISHKKLNPDLAFDNVHLNEKGYVLLTKLIKSRIHI